MAKIEKREFQRQFLMDRGVSEKTVNEFFMQLDRFADKSYCEMLLCGFGTNGHADRHIWMDDQELHNRAFQKLRAGVENPCASRFYTDNVLKIAALVKQVILGNKNLAEVAKLLVNKDGIVDKVALYARASFVIGEVANAKADRRKLYPLHGIYVILKRGDCEPFYVLTTYPDVTKTDEVAIDEDKKKWQEIHEQKLRNGL